MKSSLLLRNLFLTAARPYISEFEIEDFLCKQLEDMYFVIAWNIST
jgi:hypothetical protein